MREVGLKRGSENANGVSALVLIKKSALFLIANINERSIFMAIQLLSI